MSESYSNSTMDQTFFNNFLLTATKFLEIAFLLAHIL